SNRIRQFSEDDLTIALAEIDKASKEILDSVREAERQRIITKEKSEELQTKIVQEAERKKTQIAFENAQSQLEAVEALRSQLEALSNASTTGGALRAGAGALGAGGGLLSGLGFGALGAAFGVGGAFASLASGIVNMFESAAAEA